ncbi:MAG TPA: hypothetical protein VEB60_03370 [Candidatus Paceibacterota bacterium]|nr:hypothetical protein [Candidatus Paceibacterota bacterium]
MSKEKLPEGNEIGVLEKSPSLLTSVVEAVKQNQETVLPGVRLEIVEIGEPAAGIPLLEILPSELPEDVAFLQGKTIYLSV